MKKWKIYNRKLYLSLFFVVLGVVFIARAETTPPRTELSSQAPVQITLEAAYTDVRTDLYDDPAYGTVRVFVLVKNISAQKLDSATLRCDLVSESGKPFAQVLKVVSSLEPGVQKEYFFLAQTVNLRVPFKVYLLDWKLSGRPKADNPDKDTPVIEGQSTYDTVVPLPPR